MPATTNIIDTLGISWTLTVQQNALLYYIHPTFGYLAYQGATPWLCDNTNTLTLTSSGSLPAGVLPAKVCVRPKYDAAGCGCYDLNPYTNPPDQKACCDPGCSFEFPLFLTCDGVTETCDATFTIGGGNGIDGIEDHTGPTYGASCTLIGVELAVNLYCDGADWLADIYMDGNHCQTFNCGPPTECCPLVITGGTADTCNYCVPCIGDDCVEPPIQTECCEETIPATLTITISGDCTGMNGTFTATFQAVTNGGSSDEDGNAWVGNPGSCIEYFNLWCNQVDDSMQYQAKLLDCGGFSAVGSFSVTCDPFLLTSTINDGGGSPGCCDCDGSSSDITVTA